MEAKEFLRQYQNTLIDIRNMEAEALELEEMALSITVNTENERVQSSGSGDSMASLVAKICDMKIMIMEKRSLALDKLQQVERVIAEVENKDYRQLLHRRYIEGNTWEKIAVEMNYSYQWICKLHGRALPEIERILKAYDS
ncbi:MAG: hypothetical protein PHY71_02245 [Bacteroidaceae bacterium]|nr:hypothetical protein [Bacteroidaceae bacterium]